MNPRLARIDRLAVKFEKAAKVLLAYDAQRLQDAILKADPSIINDLKRFGVERIYGSGYVIHHFKNAPYHYLSKSKNRKYDYAELAKILNDKNYKKVIRKRIIEEELPHTTFFYRFQVSDHSNTLCDFTENSLHRHNYRNQDNNYRNQD